ncbi:hypothetical protein Tco_0418049 [Tanacetum coccineum]
MDICPINGYQVCRVPVTIRKSYKVEVLCIVDDIDECHILLGRPWRCEVNGKYDVKRNLYLFSWTGNRIAIVLNANLLKDKVRSLEGVRGDEALKNILTEDMEILKCGIAFSKKDELEYAEPLDREAKQVTYIVQRVLCSPKVSDSSQRNRIFQIKCLVKEKHYNELVTYDVIDIEACHVLLGRPWQHDVDSTHQGFVSLKKKLKSKTLVTLVASPKDFQAERKETSVSHALVMKGVNDVMKNAIPTIIKPLLAEFGFDSIKELCPNDEDYGNIWMELETKQHQGEILLLDGYLFKGNRLCIPKTYLKIQLVKEIHAKGLNALGRDKTIASVENCDDGSRPEEQHLVVPCSDEEIVKFLTQPATTEISGDNGSNLEDFLIVLTREEADIIGPIMVVEDEPLMMLGLGPNIIKEDFSNDLDRQHSTDEKIFYAQRRTWDPGITWLKILKEHLEDKINDNAYVVDLPNSMSILKTFNVSDIYEFHFEDVNEGKHSRTSSSKERRNDEDMIQELAEEYMVSKNK